MKMMPSAQPITMISPPTSKPKIGFSIESIVGNRVKNSSVEYHEDSNEASQDNLPKLPTSPTDLRREYSHLMKRARQAMTPSPHNGDDVKSITRLSESSDQDLQNNNKNFKTTPTRSPSPSKPIMVPGISAEMMNRLPMMQQTHGHHQFPSYPEIPPGHPHFLQFQAAAAFVHAQNAQTGFNGCMPQHHPHLHNPNIPRDSYQLYPWLLSRHGRIFPHRFPGNFPDFLLQPFRKPKRVRTAFSPTQLLKLEHAFEGNHYVVGAERKTLAQQLGLTETQVKVWFQNRRTKHKRTQQEDGDSKSGNGNKSPGSPKNFDSDEGECMDDDEIDIEEDDEDNMA